MTALKPIESAEAVRPLGWAPSGSPQVLVAVLADDPEIVAAGLVHSRPAVPHADWVGVSLPSHVPAGRLARVLSQEPALRERASARLVLLGHGYAGGIALGLVLGGALTCSGIVGLDTPQRRTRSSKQMRRSGSCSVPAIAERTASVWPMCSVVGASICDAWCYPALTMAPRTLT
jgi:hypothetical protein